jgi:hypothetical protein
MQYGTPADSVAANSIPAMSSVPLSPNSGGRLGFNSGAADNGMSTHSQNTIPQVEATNTVAAGSYGYMSLPAHSQLLEQYQQTRVRLMLFSKVGDGLHQRQSSLQTLPLLH